MNETLELIVAPQEAGMRIDAYLNANTAYSRSRAAALIQEGFVSAGGKTVLKPSVKVESGALITVKIPETKDTEIVPQDIPLDILYQDADIVIVNNPA